MEEIVWSARASKDVLGIYQYISADSTFFASQCIDKIIARVYLLPSQPKMGRIVPEKNNPDIREIIEGNYRIMYRVSKKQIIVYRIIHVARNFK